MRFGGLHVNTPFQVNLTKDDISTKGKYVLELRTYTTYRLHSIYKPLRLIKCLHNIQDTPVFMTEVNRHIHLYVFGKLSTHQNIK